MQVADDAHETPVSRLDLPSLGLGVSDQAVPSQASTMVCSAMPGPSNSPTAVQSPTAAQETPRRVLAASVLPGGGGTTDQAVPSQGSARGFVSPWLGVYDPTAVQLPADVQETPRSSLLDPLRGLQVTDQVV